MMDKRKLESRQSELGTTHGDTEIRGPERPLVERGRVYGKSLDSKHAISFLTSLGRSGPLHCLTSYDSVALLPFHSMLFSKARASRAAVIVVPPPPPSLSPSS